jgi:Fe-S-cluster containining protein
LAESSEVFSLSIHADYRCRHSGRCCTADWDVPVELSVYRSLGDALAAGRLQTAAASLAPLVVEPDLPEGAAAMLERTGDGDCVFFERESRLCVVHRDLGESALPLTCRHFPRVSLQDGRGTFVTLSHFCPTAAGMLFREDVALAIVRAPGAFPLDDYDGLRVTPDDLPPLLHPGMLMDPDGYSAWEAHMVARCAVPGARPETVLATLVRDADMLRHWQPGSGSLADAVQRLPREPEEKGPDEDLLGSLMLQREALQAVPDDLKPPLDEEGLDDAYRASVRPVWDAWRAPMTRYIAAKAFASWTAYQGRGIATIVRGLEAAVALVRVESARSCRDAGRRLDEELLLEAFRSADFVLNHLAVSDELARYWSAAEIRLRAAD